MNLTVTRKEFDAIVVALAFARSEVCCSTRVVVDDLLIRLSDEQDRLDRSFMGPLQAYRRR